MSKTSKHRKAILHRFEDLTDDELLSVTKNIVIEYTKLIKSEEEANKILLKYNLPKCHSFCKEITEKRYTTLTECVKFRKLTIPQEWFDVNIEEKDIIDRLKEAKSNHLMWIYKHSYLLDGCHDENLKIQCHDKEYNIKEDTLWKLDKKQEEISTLYDEIIKKEIIKKSYCKD